MNLFSILNRGARHAPSDADRERERERQNAERIRVAAEKTRAQWLNALMVDETRAWFEIGQRSPEVLQAFAIMLTIAGMVSVYDTRDVESADLRVIRGAVSAATQASNAGFALTLDEVRAFSSAAQRAAAVIRAGSVDAIIHAAQSIRETVGIEA